MKKLNILRVFVLLLSIGIIASCGDDESVTPTEAPAINVSESLIDSVFTSGTREIDIELVVDAGYKSIEVVASPGDVEILSQPDEGDRTGDATILYTAPNTTGNATVTVTVTDLVDEVSTEQITLRIVEGNLGIDENATKVIPNHANGEGSIDITPVAGVPPFEFEWSNGATTEDISGLAPGEYTVTITDAIGQTFTSDPFVIEEAGVIMIDGDKNVYYTIEYGGFYWIDRDLQTTSFGDGTAISVKEYNFGSGEAIYNAGELEPVVYVVKDFVVDSLGINEEEVYYYTLAAAAEVCPEGWTLPWKAYMETTSPNIIMPENTASWTGYGIPLDLWPAAVNGTSFNLGGIKNTEEAAEFQLVGDERVYWGAYLDDGSGNLANGTIFYNSGNGNGNIINLFADNSGETEEVTGVYAFWGNNNKDAFCVRCVKKK